MKNNVYLTEVNKLKNKSWIDQVVLKRFINRLQKPLLNKEDCLTDHICVFFLPIDIEAKQIYLCHHIKAQDWIPPGGHIDKGETPVKTIKRELIEELNYYAGSLEIHMFDLSIKYIVNPRHGCEHHYDIWHWLPIKKRCFKYTKKEYYDARWVTIPEANKLCKHNPDYLRIINKIPKIIFLPPNN